MKSAEEWFHDVWSNGTNNVVQIIRAAQAEAFAAGAEAMREKAASEAMDHWSDGDMAAAILSTPLPTPPAGAASVSQWRTMEDAPRDGTRFLAYWPESAPGAEDEATMTTWFGLNQWQTPHESADPSDTRAPTHWMPLPTPHTGEK